MYTCIHTYKCYRMLFWSSGYLKYYRVNIQHFFPSRSMLDQNDTKRPVYKASPYHSQPSLKDWGDGKSLQVNHLRPKSKAGVFQATWSKNRVGRLDSKLYILMLQVTGMSRGSPDRLAVQQDDSLIRPIIRNIDHNILRYSC